MCKVKTLKKIVKAYFYRYYNIKPFEQDASEKLSFACEGRIVRSLTNSKKKVSGAYILNGIQK